MSPLSPFTRGYRLIYDVGLDTEVQVSAHALLHLPRSRVLRFVLRNDQAAYGMGPFFELVVSDGRNANGFCFGVQGKKTFF